MDLFELTRALVDIESITENELAVGTFLYDYLAEMTASTPAATDTATVRT